MKVFGIVIGIVSVVIGAVLGCISVFLAIGIHTPAESIQGQPLILLPYLVVTFIFGGYLILKGSL